MPPVEACNPEPGKAKSPGLLALSRATSSNWILFGKLAETADLLFFVQNRRSASPLKLAITRRS